MKKNFFVVVLLILVVGVMGYIIYEKESIKDNAKPVKEETKKEEVKESKEILKDESKDIVYDLVNVSYENGEYNYKLPVVNINSDYSNEINNEINEIKNEYNQVFTSKEYTGVIGINYNFYKNNDILSLVINITVDGDNYYYYAYNINMKTGNYVSNKELMDNKKINKKDITNKLNEFINSYMGNARETSVSDTKKYNELIYGLPMYLNDKNELCIVSYYQPEAGSAGVHSYKFNYDLNNLEIIK